MNNWVQLTKILANDGAAQDGFGNSVAIYGGAAAIGAKHDDEKSTNSGSAHIFT